ncbi:uncharacterized protein LOC105834282 [Monomorium pharaonis]|uniref:uncharacterized protein LOC105834282 n=1 Tax=Monomorium pharaonis TaxID=307658 RepID=UPI00102E142A|nr:uncharacterized protein LOC105834282 [Monomorium pharaonis]
MLLLLMVLNISILILYLYWPYIFHTLFSTNKTRLYSSLPFMIEYFVDQKKYLYLILLHASAAFIIGGITLLATGTMLIVYLQYVCGMFQIASYRMMRAMMKLEIQQKKNLQNENLIYKEIICAIDMHRKAMKFSDSSIYRFEVMFFFLIVVGVICGSLNFFRVYQVISYEYDIMKLSLPIVFIIIQFMYMIMGCYFAQEVMDHNNDVFVTVYGIQWYIAPLQIQKVILFLLQRNTKAFHIKIAGMFVASLEGAATLLNIAMSYFTVLYSTRQ